MKGMDIKGGRSHMTGNRMSAGRPYTQRLRGNQLDVDVRGGARVGGGLTRKVSLRRSASASTAFSMATCTVMSPSFSPGSNNSSSPSVQG